MESGDLDCRKSYTLLRSVVPMARSQLACICSRACVWVVRMRGRRDMDCYMQITSVFKISIVKELREKSAPAALSIVLHFIGNGWVIIRLNAGH